jgi:hypothetical protein
VHPDEIDVHVSRQGHQHVCEGLIDANLGDFAQEDITGVDVNDQGRIA